MRYLYLTLLLILPITTVAQTVVEWNNGKPTVRSKTYDDYNRHTTKVSNDSILYIRNLKSAYNALSADSLLQAERLFKHCLKQRPTAPGNYIIQRTLGDIAYAQQRYPDAIKYYSTTLRLAPRECSTRLQRAETYLAIGNASAALNDCQILHPFAQTDSLRARVYFVEGSAHLYLRHYAKTVEEMQHVLKLQPKHRNALLLLAIATYNDNRPKEAISILETYIKEYPKDEDALLLRYEWKRHKRKR